MNQNLRVLLPILVAGAAAAFLAACSTSPPARFYTLSPETALPAVAPLAGRAIMVGPIELPQYLNQPQMVIRGKEGEITYLEFQRWAEPVESAFLRVFTEDLIVAAGTQQVVAMPILQRLPTDFRVAARVSRFDVDQTGQAKLVVQWYVSDGEQKVIIAPRQATYSRVAAMPLQPESSAAALSGTIADFAADVARNIAAPKQ